MHIEGINSDCGCVATNTSTDEILPGDNSAIRVVVNRDVGRFRENVFVHTDDPVTPIVILQVSGVILPAIDYPKKIILGQLEKGERISKMITLTNNMKNNVEITGHTASTDKISVTMKEKVIPAGGSLEIQTILALTDIGYHNESLVFHLADEDKTELVVQFQGRVLGGIVALPANLFLGVLSPHQEVQHTIQLKTDSVQAFSVLNVTSDNFEVSAELSEENQAVHDVLLSLSAGDAPKGLIEGIIWITTDSPDVPQIAISVKGVYP